jgi:TetR/AcrR family transcriptional regulator
MNRALRQEESGRGRRGPELLQVARQLFFEQGYHGTTVEQVARAAGFSKRTVYLYFKNKDELFLTVGEEGLILLRRELEALDPSGMTVEQGIRAVLDVYLAFAREHPQYFRIIFQEATAEMIAKIPVDFRRRLEEHERACLGVVVAVAEKALSEGIVSGIQPWEIAAAFWGTVTGIVLLSMGGSQTVFTRSSREELVEKAVWILYAGMKTTGEKAVRI